MNIENQNLEVTVDSGAITRLAGVNGLLFNSSAVSLWEITLRSRSGEKAVFDAKSFEQCEHGNTLSWRVAEPSGISFVVEVVITAFPDSLTQWQINITGVPEDWTVFEVVFPCFDWKLDDDDRYHMLLPQDRGIDKVNPLINLPDLTELWVRREFRKRSYPNCFATMQCFGLFDGDDYLYFAAHDPVPAVKNFYFKPDLDAKAIAMRPRVKTGWRYGEDYHSFPWAFASGKGDWFDIGTRYRKFALTASWTAGGSLEESDKTPRWYQDTPIVLLKDYRGEMYDADAFVKVAEYLRVPLLLHYYLWHMPAFDEFYPFLFPTIPHFREDMRKLQAAGVRVMPYINGYSADNEMPEFKYLTGSAIRKNEQMQMHAQVWSQNRALAAMCPRDALWKRIMNMVAMRCVEMGVDGIYFDEISASPAHNCYAENHDHIPGDEYAFVSGHRQMLGAVRKEGREINPDLVMAVESSSEAYMDVLDAYLVGNGNANDEVPLFEVVYHDYTIGFGQYIYTRELDNIKFKDAIEGKCARQFSFGSQFAWSRIPLLAIMEKLPEAAAFIKTLAHAKHQHSDYLTRGKMLRPLKLDVPQLTQHWSKTYYDEEGEDITLPAVLNSIWIKNDTSIAVVLVNISEQPETIIVNLAANPEDYPLPQGGVVRVYDHLGESISKFVAQGDSDKFTVTVEPKHVIVATFGSEKPYGVHCVDPGTLNSDVDINRVMI